MMWIVQRTHFHKLTDRRERIVFFCGGRKCLVKNLNSFLPRLRQTRRCRRTTAPTHLQAPLPLSRQTLTFCRLCGIFATSPATQSLWSRSLITRGRFMSHPIRRKEKRRRATRNERSFESNQMSIRNEKANELTVCNQRNNYVYLHICNDGLEEHDCLYVGRE